MIQHLPDKKLFLYDGELLIYAYAPWLTVSLEYHLSTNQTGFVFPLRYPLLTAIHIDTCLSSPFYFIDKDSLISLFEERPIYVTTLPTWHNYTYHDSCSNREPCFEFNFLKPGWSSDHRRILTRYHNECTTNVSFDNAKYGVADTIGIYVESMCPWEEPLIEIWIHPQTMIKNQRKIYLPFYGTILSNIFSLSFNTYMSLCVHFYRRDDLSYLAFRTVSNNITQSEFIGFTMCYDDNPIFHGPNITWSYTDVYDLKFTVSLRNMCPGIIIQLHVDTMNYMSYAAQWRSVMPNRVFNSRFRHPQNEICISNTCYFWNAAYPSVGKFCLMH